MIIGSLAVRRLPCAPWSVGQVGLVYTPMKFDNEFPIRATLSCFVLKINRNQWKCFPLCLFAVLAVLVCKMQRNTTIMDTAT